MATITFNATIQFENDDEYTQGLQKLNSIENPELTIEENPGDREIYVQYTLTEVEVPDDF